MTHNPFFPVAAPNPNTNTPVDPPDPNSGVQGSSSGGYPTVYVPVSGPITSTIPPGAQATPRRTATPQGTDLRTRWVSQDGEWAVIEAVDLPSGCPRSKTRDTIDDAKGATWDPSLTTTPGPGSIHKFVKVKRRHLPWENAPNTPGSAGINPATWGSKPKKVKQIPDYPQRCPNCGGRMLVLFSSIEHEGGECPGPALEAQSKRRRV